MLFVVSLMVFLGGIPELCENEAANFARLPLASACTDDFNARYVKSLRYSTGICCSFPSYCDEIFHGESVRA